MIKFENVAYHYQDREVLTDVNMHLEPGSFHFLTGPSGSGKTTILKMCSLDLLPSKGSITLVDKETRDLTRKQIANVRQQMGIVNQDCAFIDHLNIYDNVLLPIVAAGYDGEIENQNIVDLLAWIGLGERLTDFPNELSGGEQTRVALARALILTPDIILADEPTGNLDWRMALHVLEMLIQLNRAGKTILIATHDFNIIRAAKGKVQTKIIRLNQGRIEIAGSSL